MADTTLLLDLDGTLWDSRPWFARILARASAEAPAPIEERLARGANIVALARDCGLSRARLARRAHECSDNLHLYDGAIETLGTLVDLETPMGVVTNLPAWLVNPMIAGTGLDEYFDTVITPNRFSGIPPKPNPAGIIAAIRAISPTSDSTIWFIGDGNADAGAAIEAGVRFAWASYGYETDPPPGTDRVLAQICDILEL